MLTVMALMASKDNLKHSCENDLPAVVQQVHEAAFLFHCEQIVEVWQHSVWTAPEPTNKKHKE